MLFVRFPELHKRFLDDNQVIADLVYAFADKDDEISSEEQEKLPEQLQFVTHKRIQCAALTDTLIELLAQVRNLRKYAT